MAASPARGQVYIPVSIYLKYLVRSSQISNCHHSLTAFTSFDRKQITNTMEKMEQIQLSKDLEQHLPETNYIFIEYDSLIV